MRRGETASRDAMPALSFRRRAEISLSGRSAGRPGTDRGRESKNGVQIASAALVTIAHVADHARVSGGPAGTHRIGFGPPRKGDTPRRAAGTRRTTEPATRPATSPKRPTHRQTNADIRTGILPSGSTDQDAASRSTRDRSCSLRCTSCPYRTGSPHGRRTRCRTGSSPCRTCPCRRGTDCRWRTRDRSCSPRCTSCPCHTGSPHGPRTRCRTGSSPCSRCPCRSSTAESRSQQPAERPERTPPSVRTTSFPASSFPCQR
jgi:hypothetical protein